CPSKSPLATSSATTCKFRISLYGLPRTFARALTAGPPETGAIGFLGPKLTKKRRAIEGAERLYKRSAKFVVIGLIVLSSCVGVSHGPACELEGLPSAFAGLLSHCSLSGIVIQRKS